MAGFNTESSLTPRAEAIGKITELATSKGLKGTFKVLYNGSVVADPSNLPDQVDMSKVQVSAVLDQAGK